jgi:hypothetical protein
LPLLNRLEEKNQNKSLKAWYSNTFTAYTFIIYQQLMGGLRKRYANKSLATFAETLEAFLTEVQLLAVADCESDRWLF